ncbi:hypothetical protein JL720_14903 [Aureococcus anophagefferens]|nr:hypothetical protein JL720_14903 [Aureococcus anophagefferens]
MALSKILAEVDSIAATVFVAVVVASLIYLKSSPPPPKAETTATPASVGALMRARRSIFPKDFASDPQIPREAVERALACANWAPTHGKAEPWRRRLRGPSGVDKFLAMKHAAIAAQPGLPEDARKAALTKAEKKAKDLRKCAYIIAICVKRLRQRVGQADAHSVSTVFAFASVWTMTSARQPGVARGLVAPLDGQRARAVVLVELRERAE